MENILKHTESTIFAPSLSEKTIAQIITDNGKISPKILEIKTAQRYFEGHSDIEKKERVYFDKDQKSHKNPSASNAKIRTNFLRMLVQQKQDYALAKTFVLKISSESQEEVNLDEDEYGKAWKNFCDRELFKFSYKIAGQAVNCGIAWVYLWIDDNGNLKIKDIPSELVYPIWVDRNHTDLNRLVYNFLQARYFSTSPQIIEYAEYWTKNERHLYNVSSGYSEESALLDGDGKPLSSHMTDGVSWEKIPFVALKGTTDEKTQLSFIKDLIDVHEKLDSNSVDSLIDDLDPLLIFKGISPNVKDLIEARELAKITRTISLDSDGDAHFIQAQTQISAYLEKISSIRKDILKFGYGVDSQDVRFGGNPNQLLIRSMYQDLDTYTDGLERNFQNFIDDLKYFFDKWWELSGRGSFDIAQSYKVLIKFDRSMMINEGEKLNDALRLQGVVSNKTILENIPQVQDVEIEKARLQAEKDEEQEQADNSMFNFPKKESEESHGEEQTSIED